MNVIDNVAFPLKQHEFAGCNYSPNGANETEAVGLRRGEIMPSQLSGGMQRRAALMTITRA